MNKQAHSVDFVPVRLSGPEGQAVEMLIGWRKGEHFPAYISLPGSALAAVRAPGSLVWSAPRDLGEILQ